MAYTYHFFLFQVSDGPNGIRGNHFFLSTPAKAIPVCINTCIPQLRLTFFFWQCATALGATFDTELIQTIVSKLLAPEAKLRAVSIVLAPTVNIQRVSHLMPPYFSGVLVLMPGYSTSRLSVEEYV